MLAGVAGVAGVPGFTDKRCGIMNHKMCGSVHFIFAHQLCALTRCSVIDWSSAAGHDWCDAGREDSCCHV